MTDALSVLLLQTLNGLASASSLFLVAVGLSLIFGVTRIVNFAHGSFYMLGVYVAYSVATHWSGALGFWGGVLVAGLVVAAIGVLVEFVVLRRIYAAPELLQLIATFALVLIIKDVALFVWGPEDLLGPRAPGFKDAIDIFGRPFPTYDLLLIVMGVAMLAALTMLMKKTRFGLLLRAATQDREMTDALGVNQKLLFTAVFALGSFLAGVGGALQLPREPASLAMDLNIIADVFVVVVIGGLGSLHGAFIAAIIISLVKAYCIGLGATTVFGVEFEFSKLTLVAEFIVMALVLIFKPNGLFGKPINHARVSYASSGGSGKPRMPQWATLACGLVALIALPFFVDDYSAVLATDIAVFALFAASLGLVIGVAGLGSFGHAAYFGLGAYGAALAAKAGVGFAPSLAAGVLLALAAAVVFGWFCVRLSGTYMAMLTLAFAQIVWSIVFQWDAVTGGSNGIVGVWPPEWLADRNNFYWLALLLCGGGVLTCWWITFTPLGFSIRAARDSSVKAQAIGLNPRALQWTVFSCAGAMAGLAGAVYAFSKGSISPDVSSIPRSVDALVMVLLGGINTLLGPVVGAAVFTWLQDTLARSTEYWRAVLGAIILLLVLAFPAGIVGSIQRFVSWAKLRRSAA
ncbi:MAG: ABC transporter permease [Betaproteobacteria bacterium]|nr:MAG: ABC transporter permease [Betaproteobacteria bacterium]